MDSNYLDKYEPIFGEYYVKKKLGEGSFGAVYEIEREDMGDIYSAAIKVISIPTDNEILETMQLQGEDPKEYCESMARSLRNEIRMMSKLKGNSNIVSYENHKTVPHEDGIGWDILIKMELLTPLLQHLKTVKIDEKLVIRIGIDLCKALEICHKEGIIHRDIKPANIFYSELGSYKLGDFGVSKMNAKTYAGTRVGTLNYMAPEVFDGNMYDKKADLYSLGLVLYTLANGYFLPFEEKGGDAAARSIANSKRTVGMPLPKPSQASDALADVILKACAFTPKERFESATEMRKALAGCLRGEKPKTEVKAQKVEEKAEHPAKPEVKKPETKTSSPEPKINKTQPKIPVKTMPTEPLVSTEGTIWDCVYFGSYYQSSLEEKELIKWRVLSMYGDEVLLLADKILDYGIAYNNKWQAISWKDCSIREWLNNFFIKTAFSAEEQKAIIEKKLDKAFLLSTDEVVNEDYGFSSAVNYSKTREAVKTVYAAEKGGSPAGSSDWWWLRSPGRSTDTAANVGYYGYVDINGYDVDYDDYGVRPALFLNLQSTNWEYAGTVSSDGTVKEQ